MTGAEIAYVWSASMCVAWLMYLWHQGRFEGIVDAVWKHAAKIVPTQEIADPKLIAELEEWNASWCHPELSTDFYYWSVSAGEYRESSRSRNPKAVAKDLKICYGCGRHAWVDSRAGRADYCKPCYYEGGGMLT